MQRSRVGTKLAVTLLAASIISSAQAQTLPRAEISAWVNEVAQWHYDFAQWHFDVVTSPVFLDGSTVSAVTHTRQASEARRLSANAQALAQRGMALSEPLSTHFGTANEDAALDALERITPRVNALTRAITPHMDSSWSAGMSAMESELRADLVMVWLQLGALADRLQR
jgi:hypothetical protein